LLEHATVGPFDILGEEEGLKGSGTRWRWTVDPIDGTRSFVHGIPLFGTLIALLDTQKNIPVIGVIHLPMLGVTCAAAKDHGTLYQGQSVHLRKNLEIGDAIIGVGDIAQFRDAKRDADLQTLQALSGYVRTYSDCFGHSLVVSGALGAMLDPALNPWDILATQVLIEEAGGRMLLRPSCIPEKVDALFGNCQLVDALAQKLAF
jgi:myo-inositol-1(or 4)-monophosphatase